MKYSSFHQQWINDAFIVQDLEAGESYIILEFQVAHAPKILGPAGSLIWVKFIEK